MAGVIDDRSLIVNVPGQGSEFVADVVCGRDQPVCLFEEAVMVLENFSVEIQKTLFEALEVVMVDCGKVGGDVLGEHGVHGV